MNYDTFKQYMRRLAREYEYEPNSLESGKFANFSNWLAHLPEPEKKEEKRWKPKQDERYYVPAVDAKDYYFSFLWFNESSHAILYKRGLVCKTPEEAIALAKRMLEAIKN